MGAEVRTLVGCKPESFSEGAGEGLSPDGRGGFTPKTVGQDRSRQALYMKALVRIIGISRRR